MVDDHGVLALAVAEPVNCVVPIVVVVVVPEIVGNALIVPLAATLTVVAPVELNTMLPEGEPVAVVANLANMVVVVTTPLD